MKPVKYQNMVNQLQIRVKFSQTAPKQIRKNQLVQKIEIACKSQFK